MILKYLAPVGMLLGGTILTIGRFICACYLDDILFHFNFFSLTLFIILASSFQNKQIIDGQKYFHPFIQTFCYFLGESFCYLFFVFRKSNKGAENQQNDHHHTAKKQDSSLTRLPNFAFYPAILDGIAMTLQYSSLTLISPSVYQILRGGVIIVTAVLSVTVLKKKLNPLNIIGLLVVLMGIVIVGAANLAFGVGNHSKAESSQISAEDDSNDQIIGYILIIVSLLANGMLFIQEEKLIKEHQQMKPLDLVGFEGIWGVVYYSGFLLLLNFIPCSGRFCVHSSSNSNSGTIESVPIFFSQLASNQSLIISQLIVLVTIGFYAFSAVSVTKHLSAMVRSLIDVTRCLFVWFVGIVITTNSDQQWESLNPIGITLQTIGFLFIVVGSLVYNQLLFKKSALGGKSVKQEFSLALLDKSGNDHEGYHKLADHESKKHSKITHQATNKSSKKEHNEEMIQQNSSNETNKDSI